VPRAVAPSTGTTVALWIAASVMAAVALYYCWSTLVGGR